VVGHGVVVIAGVVVGHGVVVGQGVVVMTGVVVGMTQHNLMEHPFAPRHTVSGFGPIKNGAGQ